MFKHESEKQKPVLQSQKVLKIIIGHSNDNLQNRVSKNPKRLTGVRCSEEVNLEVQNKCIHFVRLVFISNRLG